MSADHDHSAHEEDHTGPIKTPKQLAWAVFFAFVVPVIIIIMLAYSVTTNTKPGAGAEAFTAEAVAARLAPAMPRICVIGRSGAAADSS